MCTRIAQPESRRSSQRDGIFGLEGLCVGPRWPIKALKWHIEFNIMNVHGCRERGL